MAIEEISVVPASKIGTMFGWSIDAASSDCAGSGRGTIRPRRAGSEQLERNPPLEPQILGHVRRSCRPSPAATGSGSRRARYRPAGRRSRARAHPHFCGRGTIRRFGDTCTEPAFQCSFRRVTAFACSWVHRRSVRGRCGTKAKALVAGLSVEGEADDGTRTHDLLHGKRAQAFAPVRARSLKLPICGAVLATTGRGQPERTTSVTIVTTDSLLKRLGKPAGGLPSTTGH